MDPYDSPAEAAFRSDARSFLEANAAPLPELTVAPSSIIAERTPDEEVERLADAMNWQRLKFENGWAGISWPQAYGGRGGSLIEDLIFRQAEARFDVPHDSLIVGLGWCGPAVMAHATEAQRLRFLPPLLAGDEVWCQLFSEPGAGSDSAGMQTRALRDGDEWVITGQKVWTTLAHQSDWGLCIARHDPNVAKHSGLTAFMVDMGADGVETRPLRQMTRSANFNEVFLDGVRVPDEHRIGGIGDGWRVVVSTYMWERLGVVGGGEQILAGLARLIQESGRAGEAEIRDRYAKIYATGQALGYTGLRLMTAISRGDMPGPEGSIIKLGYTSAFTAAFELAIDILDAEGMLSGTGDRWGGEWQGGFLGAPGLRIGGGTDQVQRNIIGERVLGLPTDIRVDKDVPFAEIPSG